MTFPGSGPSSRTRSVLLVSALFAVVGLVSPAAASAADDRAAPVTRWALTPASADGPDVRRSIEHVLAPGGAVEDHLAVRNAGSEAVTYALDSTDGFMTPEGRFDTLVDGQESVGAGTWVQLPETVTVPAGATVVVPFTERVPEDAQPGDHAAGITASVVSVQSAADGTSVGVRTRFGIRVTTRVTGEVEAAASLSELEAAYTTTWSAVRPGSTTVTFEVTNDGNTRLLAQGEVRVAGASARFPAAGQKLQELLPGDTRRFSVPVSGVWPVVLAPARVTLTPEATTVSDGAASAPAPTVAPVVSDVWVWALPWPQLVVLAGAVLLLWALLSGRRRSRRRLEALVESARDEGRRQAREAASGASAGV